MKIFFSIVLIVLVEVATGALFTIKDKSTPDEFVLELTNAERVQEARDMIASKKPRMLIGIIIKKKADYNCRWSYHVDPNTIKFTFAMYEVCDASIQYLEDHLQEAGGPFLPDNRWCPWHGVMTREIKVDA